MTNVPATAQPPNHSKHKIDAVVSSLIRLLARQAAREQLQAPGSQDAKDDQNDKTVG